MHRWEDDNISRYLRPIVWKDVDWIDLVQEKDQWEALLNSGLS